MQISLRATDKVSPFSLYHESSPTAFAFTSSSCVETLRRIISLTCAERCLLGTVNPQLQKLAQDHEVGTFTNLLHRNLKLKRNTMLIRF